jgi:hypothetical protein
MMYPESKGDFSKTTKFLEFMKRGDHFRGLDKYGQRGVDALASATPRDTGETAQSWGYRIKHTKRNVFISWYNTHQVDGVNIAVIIQYGHGTGTGGYVQGREYINPAIRPIFDQIAEDVWRQVTNG